MTAIIIPFGKHKGKTVDEVKVLDPQYLEFLNMQDWMREKFPAILAAAAALNGDKHDDTPAHNAIQMRFLDSEFRRKFCLQVKSRASPESSVRMETAAGWDCQVRFLYERVLYSANRTELDEAWVDVEIKPHMSDDYPSILRTMNRRIAVAREKGSRYRHTPNDYGTHQVLVVKTIDSVVASLDQIQWYFANSHIQVMLLSEIEEYVPPRIIKRRPK